MNTKQFITFCEHYFGGKYNQIQRSEIENYLSRFEEQYLDELTEAVKLHIVPTAKKPLPIIADFNSLKNEIKTSALPENTSIFHKGENLLEEREMSEEEAEQYFQRMRKMFGDIAQDKNIEGGE